MGPEGLPAWFLYSFPGAAWAYSIAMFMALLWHDVNLKLAVSLMLVGPVLAIAGEAGQSVEIVPGTIDPADFTLIIIGLAAALLIVQSWRRSI